MAGQSLQQVEEDWFAGLNVSICSIPEVANMTEMAEFCTSEPHDFVSPIPAYVMTIIQIFYGLVCTCGLVGNSLVIYVVLRFSKLHTVTNTYILNLAIADECFLVGIPFLIATTALKEWPFGEIMCKVYFATTSINQITSSLFLMVLSADRYVAVCHPISSPRFRTGLIAKIVSLSAWLLSALLMLPVFLYATTITRPDGGNSCNIFWNVNFSQEDIINQQTAFTFYSLAFGFAGPLFFILIFYGLVLVKLCTMSRARSSRSPSQKRLQGKVTRLVLTVITVYILCWLPHWVAQLVLILSPPSKTPDHMILVVLISDCLQYFNSAINPVLYAFLSDNFKKSFRQACYCYTKNTAQFIPRDFSFTTRRTRRGPRFTAVLQDESCTRLKEGADHSTGIMSLSRSSKSSVSCNMQTNPVKAPVTLTVVSGRLAPPTARL